MVNNRGSNQPEEDEMREEKIEAKKPTEKM